MTLRLIGAGLPRTGTMSLKHALERLLGAPCYHMIEVFEHPGHPAVWVEAMRGRPPVWDDFLGGYAAGVDMPFSSMWRELADAYPEAPVLLSQRSSAEAWHRSMDRTVLERARSRGTGDATPGTTPEADEMFGVMGAGIMDDPDDKAAVLAGYERRLEEVRATIAPERLVEWQPGDGWEPLCRALGVPVPDEEFPHENTTAEFVARIEEDLPPPKP